MDAKKVHRWLKQAEWDWQDHEGFDQCPSCFRRVFQEHKPTCELANLIAEAEQESEQPPDKMACVKKARDTGLTLPETQEAAGMKREGRS